MNLHLHLAKFTQNADGAWEPPANVVGTIDLVPPGQDSDPSVNFALMASTVQLGSGDSYHYLGRGDPAALNLNALDRSAWESVCGYRPVGTKIVDAIAEHLTIGSQATGETRTRPVVGPVPEIWLAGERIWQYRLTDFTQPIEQAVYLAELQNLRDVYVNFGETAYRHCLWSTSRKYGLSGSVSDWLPADDDLLPWLNPLVPQTTKTETWPSAGTYSADFSQDNSWVRNAGTWVVGSNKIYPSTDNRETITLGYDFGASDTYANAVITGATGTSNMGVVTRISDNNNHYGFYWQGSSASRLFKTISGVETILQTYGTAFVLNDTIGSRCTGSTIDALRNGSVVKTATDTAIASGLRCGVYFYNHGGATYNLGQFSATDGLSPSSSSSSSSSAQSSSSSPMASSSSSSSPAPSSSSSMSSASSQSSQSSGSPAPAMFCGPTAGPYRRWCHRRPLTWSKK